MIDDTIQPNVGVGVVVVEFTEQWHHNRMFDTESAFEASWTEGSMCSQINQYLCGFSDNVSWTDRKENKDVGLPATMLVRGSGTGGDREIYYGIGP